MLLTLSRPICASIPCFSRYGPWLYYLQISSSFYYIDLMATRRNWRAAPRIHSSLLKYPSRRQGAGLLPSRHGLTPSLYCLFSTALSLHPSVLHQCVRCHKGVGTDGGGKISQYKAAFKISGPLKAIAPWRWRGWAVLYQRCHTSHWISDRVISQWLSWQRLFSS